MRTAGPFWAFTESHTIGFLDCLLGGAQGVANDEIRQVRALQRHPLSPYSTEQKCLTRHIM
jgi:hypothetical protein